MLLALARWKDLRRPAYIEGVERSRSQYKKILLLHAPVLLHYLACNKDFITGSLYEGGVIRAKNYLNEPC